MTHPKSFVLTEALRRWARLSVLASCALMLLACSSTGPKPDEAAGEIRPANTQQQALEELLEIARAAQPRRFRAERGVDVRQTLQSWAKTSGMSLQWKTTHVLRTTGVIDELKIESAVMALADQFKAEPAAVVIDFSIPRTLRAMDAQGTRSMSNACPEVPAGAIVLGRYCLAAPHKWVIEPQDQWLSSVLKRWAQEAQLQLVWDSAMDWPLRVRTTKSFDSDILTALNALIADLRSQGVNLEFSVKDNTLTLHSPL